MLTEIKNFVNQHKKEILLIFFVILISLLSFASGFIVADNLQRESIKIESQSLL